MCRFSHGEHSQLCPRPDSKAAKPQRWSEMPKVLDTTITGQRDTMAVAEFTEIFALDLCMVGDANYLMGMIIIEHGNLMESPFNII